MSRQSLGHRQGWIRALGVTCLAYSLTVTAPGSGAVPVAALDCGPTRILTAAADAWVDESSPTSNRGSDSILKVRSQGPNGNFRALVRFPVPAAAPEGCVLRTATLRVYAAAPSDGRTLQATRLASTWTESSITWNTQPGTEGPASSVGAGADQGYREWRVTAQVADGAPHGFMIRDSLEADSGEQSFHAREKGENPPELALRYAPPPDPAQGPLPPQPAAVTCGQEIVVSTLVTNDLANCLGDGLVIGESHVILDLDGHSVDGVGLAVGVRNDGFDNVTIRNGTISDFDYGVQLNPGTTRGLVEKLLLTANQVAAVELSDADGPAGGNAVRLNTLEGNGLGISLVSGTSRALVSGNTVLENAGEGLTLHESDGNTLEDNTFIGGSDRAMELFAASDNVVRANTISGSGDGGLDVVAGSHRNLIERNVLTATGDSGLYVGESDGNVLLGNAAHEMSDNGIVLSSANDSVVRGNDVRFNPTGLEISGSSRNVIEGNDASSSLGSAIEIGGGSYANLIRDNLANQGGGNGIVLGDDALLADQLEPGVDHANIVKHNTANANQGDGIEAAKGGHLLGSNVTIGNRGWGIWAESGTKTDGANVARENGEPGQCFGVPCVEEPPPPPDTTAPETTITAGPGASTEAVTARFVFTGTDQESAEDELVFECALDGAGFAACGSPVDYAGLGVGPHVFAVRAVDAAGNTDPSPAAYEWVVLEPPPPPDTTAPETTITAGPGASTEAVTARFVFTGTDQESAEDELVFECALDGAGFAACGSPVDYAGLGVGPHVFAVRAVDAAGNTDPSPAAYEWVVLEPPPPPDTTAPETTITAGPGASTEAVTARFVFTGTDQESAEDELVFECALDGAGFAACGSPVDYAGLGVGPHVFAVRAVDAAGNTDPSPAAYEWVVLEPPPPPDTTAPETTITAGPGASTEAVTARFVFTGTDQESAEDELVFECALDGAGFAACGSPVDYAGLGVGPHVFAVRAVDAAGNTDPSPAAYEWVVLEPPPPPDTTAPETTITAGPGASTEAVTARFVFTGTDQESAEDELVFECALDGAGFAACGSPVDYAGLGVGPHVFAVRAVDAAGNTDPSPAAYEWVVAEPPPPPDTTAPETTITAGPGASTEAVTARFVFTGTDQESAEDELVFECALDGAGFAACGSPVDYAGLGVGPHVFAVRAVDAAGNTDPSPAAYEWVVAEPPPPPDTTAPETTITAGPGASTEAVTARFVFTGTDQESAEDELVFECALDGAGFAACGSPVDYAGLGVGPHVFAVRAVDAAGNTDPSPAAYEWVVLEPPPPPVECGPMISMSAAADSWVDRTNARRNHGTDASLRVRTQQSTDVFRTLVRFAAEAQPPPGCAIESATLRMYASSSTQNRSLQAVRLASTWAERSVTWANQPTTTGTPAATTSRVGWLEWTVTQQVRAMYSDAAHHGFLIRDAHIAGSGEQRLHSRERRTNRPMLVVTFSPVPAAAAALRP